MDPILGTIIMFAGNFAPRGWALCNGAILSIQQNAALFSLLGTTYGGDGRTTFALPDLRGRVPVGSGNGPGLPSVTQGEKAGSSNTTLTVGNLPAHKHNVGLRAETALGDNADPTGRMLSFTSGSADSRIYAAEVPAQEVAMHPNSISEQMVGSGQPVSNMQPYLGMIYIIATEGVFPSRP